MFKGEAYSLKKFGEKSILRAVIILKSDFLKYSLNDTLIAREQMRSPHTGRCRRSCGNTERFTQTTLGHSTLPPCSICYTTYRETKRAMKTGPGSAPTAALYRQARTRHADDSVSTWTFTRALRSCSFSLLFLVSIHSSRTLHLSSGTTHCRCWGFRSR